MINTLVVKIDKGLANGYFEKGNLNEGISHYESYINSLQEQIEQNSDNEPYIDEKQKAITEFKDRLLFFAKKLYAKEDWLACANCCKYLIKYNTEANDVYKHAALCFRNMKQFDTAIELMELYTKKEPDDPHNLVYLAEGYYELDREKNAYKAVDYYKRFLEKNPNDAQVYNAIGNIYARTIDCYSSGVNEQLYYFKKALELSPDDRCALRNLHLSYLKKGDMKQAKIMYERYYDVHKDKFTHDDYFDYAAYLIYMGEFIKGWNYIDHRFEKETSATYFPEIKNAKKWNGTTNISKDTLLVHAEQGYGDVVMFIRFVQFMKKYTNNIVAVVQDELVDLFNESKLGFPIYGRSMPLEEIKFDYYIPLISLPRVYKLTPQNVPCKEGYLRVARKRISDFKKSFVKSDKFNIGVCFEGASTGKSEGRDIDWKYLKHFAEIEGVQLYCLKREMKEEDFRKIDPNLDIVCFGDNLKSFADTAAAIKSMDLIISTDNVILNLSGALGAKTFGLFNRMREYRWYGTEEGKMVWYGTVTPFQAKVHFEWEEVIMRVKAEIEKLIKKS